MVSPNSLESEEETKLKLQHEFSELACQRDHMAFLKFGLDHASTSEKILLASMKDPGLSILSNLFTANLTQKDVRLTKTEFTTVARQYVCLPPLKNDAGEVKEFKCGCQTQMCASTSSCHDKGEPLDRAGNHGLVCHPGVKAMKATIFRSLFSGLAPTWVEF